MFKRLLLFLRGLVNYIRSDEASSIEDFAERVKNAGGCLLIDIEIIERKIEDLHALAAFAAGIMEPDKDVSSKGLCRGDYFFYITVRAIFKNHRDIALEFWLDELGMCDYEKIESVLKLTEAKEKAFDDATDIANQIKILLPGILVQAQHRRSFFDLPGGCLKQS